MDIKETKIIQRQGYSLPLVKTGGHWYLIETKQTLLDLGIASMIAQTAELETDFSSPAEFTAILPADPADGRPEDVVLREATSDPAIVALARKFNDTDTL